MRKPLIILLVAELFFTILVGQGALVNRKDLARAVAAWHTNPTAETKAELDRQRKLTELARWEFTGVLFAGMAIITVGGERLRRRMARNCAAV